ncbi:LysM peptidoglycan-binding domain-containing protein [Thaumasiovibrio sp. DFM-14]|uniref:LysM peptidoglycan-binding domain-containing protein n=1 Tax=Thaumasiovibrio sp. DFM-14 TaxID=3384792 RepID=UPI0039A3139F
MAQTWRRYSQLFITLLFTALISWSASALTLKDGHPTQYVVKKGDTLWDISAYFLDSPWLWPQLWQANPAIENPHLIYPGDILHLIWVDGQPRLSSKRLTKLSPTARVSEIKQPITVLDDQLLLPFMAQDRLLDTKALSLLPRVVGSQDGRTYLTSFDDIFVDQPLAKQSRWGVYRVMEAAVRTDSEEKVFPLRHIGNAEIVQRFDKQSILNLQASGREIQQNDVLLPLASENAENFFEQMTFAPAPSPEGLKGRIVADMDGFNYQAHYQVVVLDRGYEDNLVAGHIVEVNEPGAFVRNTNKGYKYQLRPSKLKTSGEPLGERALGELMVIRPYAHFSLAVVTRAPAPIQVNTAFSSPLSRD